MVFEIAELVIDPARFSEFEAAVQAAFPAFTAADGCHSVSLERIVEDPARYLLRVEWETVEAHTETFRQSPGFQEWRRLAGPFFVEPPIVRHSAIVGIGA